MLHWLKGFTSPSSSLSLYFAYRVCYLSLSFLCVQKAYNLLSFLPFGCVGKDAKSEISFHQLMDLHSLGWLIGDELSFHPFQSPMERFPGFSFCGSEGPFGCPKKVIFWLILFNVFSDILFRAERYLRTLSDFNFFCSLPVFLTFHLNGLSAGIRIIYSLPNTSLYRYLITCIYYASYLSVNGFMFTLLHVVLYHYYWIGNLTIYTLDGHLTAYYFSTTIYWVLFSMVV